MYGDERVNQVLSRWPADTGDEILGAFEPATVGTNRNAASTDSPAPIEYDGEIQIAVNHLNTNQMVAAANTWGNAGAACNNEETQAVFYSSNGGTTWDYTCAPSNNVFALGHLHRHGLRFRPGPLLEQQQRGLPQLHAALQHGLPRPSMRWSWRARPTAAPPGSTRA